MLRLWVPIVAIVTFAPINAGCDSCAQGAGTGKALFESPPKEDVERETAAQLRTASAIASELCGVPTSGLSDVKVAVKSQLVTSSEVQVMGTALLVAADAGAEADAGGTRDAGRMDAGPKDAGHLDLARVLVCSGTLEVVMDGDFSADMQKRTNWHIVGGEAGLEVTAIDTAGVTFDEERHRASSGSSHHHHHH